MLSRWFVIALLVLSVVGCANAPVTPKISLSPRGDRVWRAEYQLEKPAAELVFDRSPGRAEDWRATDPAFHIRTRGEQDVAARIDGAPFSAVAFDMPATYGEAPKDYARFSPFSDGGLLIYSGRFHACPDRGCDDAAVWPMRLTPPAGAHVLLAGAKHVEPVSWEDQGSGRNLYVGAQTPVETAQVLAVIDPALPVQVREPLANLFPRLMDYFAERLGVLPARPMLFVSLDPDGEPGTRHIQGGTLPDQVFMHFQTPGWGPAEWEAEQPFLAWFFAHEAAHLFQSAKTPNEHAWVHEGGADAMAAIALGELKFGLEDYTRRRREESQVACAKSLSLSPLIQASADGRFDDHYKCGLLFQLALHEAARESGKGDLFAIWRAYKARVAAGARENSESFLAAAADYVDAEVIAWVRAAVLERQRDPAGFLARFD